MGPSDWISTGFALVAMLVSGVTVFYTRVQVRHAEEQVEQARRELNFAVHDSAFNLMLRMDELFLEHPMLRPHFYQDVAPPTPAADPELHHRAFAMAEFCLDVLECVWERQDKYSDVDREAWREWIHDVFAGSPVLRSLYGERQAWFPVLTSLRESRVCTAASGHSFFTDPAAPATPAGSAVPAATAAAEAAAAELAPV